MYVIVTMLTLLVCFNFTCICFAYDKEYLHPNINTESLNVSSSIDDALLALRLSTPENRFVAKNKINKWLREGGTSEDEPFTRSLNHFHDPTKAWDQAGLKDDRIGDSSIYWAQNPDQDWSWNSAKDYFFQALSLSTITEREQYLSKTFRALGQIMHLVSDAASPAHVRNDIHVFPLFEQKDKSFPQVGSWTYETWCKYNYRDINFTGSPIPTSIFSRSLVAGLDPISNLWDTKPEAGDNPNPEGLAEYTNHNFFSSDTLFKEYTFPQSNGLYLDTIVNDKGIPERRFYFKGITSDNQPINHLAATGYLWMDLVEAAPDGLDDSRFNLDDTCFKDYASILVAKAVGYSTALLDYFFRAQIDLIPDSTGVDAYRIRNLSDERMTGTFSLYHDDPDGVRLLVWEQVLDIPALTDQLAPINPPLFLSEWKRYTLVFHGQLGNEQNAVAGKVLGTNWREEWNAGLKGNHQWLLTDIDLLNQNSTGGQTHIEVLDDRLIMDSIRPSGSVKAQVNQAYIGQAQDRIGDSCYMGNDVFTCDFTSGFPLVVSPETTLQIKIDKMSINQAIPAQECNGTSWPTGAFQGVMLDFSYIDGNGQQVEQGVQITVSGHESKMWPSALVVEGVETTINLSQLLAGIASYQPPVVLTDIDIVQQMLSLCNSSPVDHVQQMKVDYIRIADQ